MFSRESAESKLKFDALIASIEKNTCYFVDACLKNEKQVKKLVDALKRNRSVSKLEFGRCTFSDETAKSFAEVLLQHTKLHTLIMCENKIGQLGIKSISRALAKNNTLHTFALTGDKNGNAWAKNLAEMLTENTGLYTLVLTGNTISDGGAECLARGLINNKTLRILDLSRNHIVDCDVFAEMLEKNASLFALELGNNQYLCKWLFNGEKECRLATSLTKNTGLKVLGLKNTHMTEVVARKITQALPKSSLFVLDLAWNDRLAGDAVFSDELIESLKQNKNLCYVHIDECGFSQHVECLEKDLEKHIEIKTRQFKKKYAYEKELKAITAQLQLLAKMEAKTLLEMGKTKYLEQVQMLKSKRTYLLLCLEVFPCPNRFYLDRDRKKNRYIWSCSIDFKHETWDAAIQACDTILDNFPTASIVSASSSGSTEVKTRRDLATAVEAQTSMLHSPDSPREVQYTKISTFLQEAQSPKVESKRDREIQSSTTERKRVLEVQATMTENDLHSWNNSLTERMHQLENSLAEANRQLGRDPKALSEKAFIAQNPLLQIYYDRFSAELSRFITCYYLAPAGIFLLEGDKKDMAISAVNSIPVAGQILGLVTKGLSFANKKHKFRRMLRLAELFKNVEHITQVVCTFARQVTILNRETIVQQVDQQYKGIRKVVGWAKSLKAELDKQWKGLSTSDKTGVSYTPQDKLAVLDMASFLKKILSKKVKIKKEEDLVAQFLMIMTGISKSTDLSENLANSAHSLSSTNSDLSRDRKDTKDTKELPPKDPKASEVPKDSKELSKSETNHHHQPNRVIPSVTSTTSSLSTREGQPDFEKEASIKLLQNEIHRLQQELREHLREQSEKMAKQMQEQANQAREQARQARDYAELKRKMEDINTFHSGGSQAQALRLPETAANSEDYRNTLRFMNTQVKKLSSAVEILATRGGITSLTGIADEVETDETESIRMALFRQD